MRLDVGTWLAEQGFGQYAELFHEHAIDAAALPLLTDAHLRELGLPLGHRLKLLEAMAALGGRAEPAPAERRRLTVMFVDLVGSTELSTRVDPEDLRELLRDYQAIVTSQAARFGAHVARYFGDAALLYFGWPQAHEDDAERAVRTALAIVEAMGARRDLAGRPLSVHVGIATGLVVVGDVLGAGAAQERAVLGETPNLAARLQSMAAPGEILVSAQTRVLAGRHFRWRERPARAMKGIAEAVVAFEVLGERTARSRFAARRMAPLNAMVGRLAEIDRLVNLWEQARNGAGRAVLITGEAGIGKSRLVRALEQAVSREAYTAIVNQCSPHHADSPLNPMIQQIGRAAGLRPGVPAEEALDRVEELLQAESAEDVVLIAAMLGLDASARHGSLEGTPEQLRLRTFDALLRQVMRASRRQPVLWILEDAHWVDPTTLELLEASLDRLGDAPILAVITARSEFADRLRPRPGLERITLARLSASEVVTLVGQLAPGEGLPADLVAEIAARADGVPLFVEEITRTVLEEGASGGVPASLHDTIMARLDRHPALKEVAQAAACIGREFDSRLLAATSGLPPQVLEDGLARLTDAGLVSPRRALETIYVFKHALVRDAAYESLLKSRRQALHGRVLEALAASGNAAPEMLAHHAHEAGLAARAMGHWREAGLAALARPAYQEAASYLRQALRAAESLPASDEQRLELLLLLGQAMIPFRGYSHADTLEVFSAANALVAGMPDTPHFFTVSHALWVAHYVRGEHAAALRIAYDLLDRAKASGSASRMLAALRTLGIGEMITGEVASAERTFDEARRLALVVRSQSRSTRMAVAQRFSADPDIATEFHVALTAASLGQLDRARVLAFDALHAARTVGHVHTLGHALVHVAIVASVLREREMLYALSQEALAFANEHDMDLWRGYASTLQAMGFALADECGAAVPAMERGFRFLARTQTGTMVPRAHAVHAYVLGRMGRWEAAQREADLVHEELAHGCQRYWWPEALRWLGELQALREETAGEAEACWRRAIDTATGQGAATFALGAATSLARHWRDLGRTAEARALLSRHLAPMVEGADRPLVMDAARLAAALGTDATGAGSRMSNLV